MKDKTLILKKFTYILCFFLLCIIDQRKGSLGGYMQFVLPNLAVFCFSLLLFPSFHRKDFMKPVYFIWLALCFLAIPLMTILFKDAILQKFYMQQWITGAFTICLWGMFLIRAILRLSFDNFFKKHIYGIASCAILLLFSLSKNDTVWSWQYLLISAVFFLTEISLEDRKLMFSSMQYGIIAAFLAMQAFAFMFRPFDQTRYCGMYCNPNINALFYMMVYIAFLGRYCACSFVKKDRLRIFLRIILLFMAACMWSFVLLTECRSAMTGMAAATLIALVYRFKEFIRMRFVKAVGLFLALFLLIVGSFPVVYCAVRYIPPIFHHPVWFFDEYNPTRVHSWDPWDSPKYIKWQSVLTGNFSRFADLLKKPEKTDTGMLPFVIDDSIPILLTSTELKPSMIPVKLSSTLSVRKTIYKQYISMFNLTGHKEEENGVAVGSYNAPHAHDLFIQYTFSYGMIAGFLFLLHVLATLFFFLKNALGKKTKLQESALAAALMYSAILVFGITEIMWLNGQLSCVLLYLIPMILNPDLLTLVGSAHEREAVL